MCCVNEPPQLSSVVSFKAVWFLFWTGKNGVRNGWSSSKNSARWLKVAVKALFWVQKIKTMPISHLPQSPSYLMWLLLGLAVQNQHFSLQQITHGDTHTLNVFWWEWLSLEDKLKDWIVAAQGGFKIHPADDWEPEKILWGRIKRMQMHKVFRFWQKAFAMLCI